jgi:hypothetical protein
MVQNLLVSEVYRYNFFGDHEKRRAKFLGLYIVRQEKKITKKTEAFHSAFGWGGGVCGNIKDHIVDVRKHILYSEYGTRESLDYKLIPWEGVFLESDPEEERVLWGFSKQTKVVVIKKLEKTLSSYHKRYHELKELLRRGYYKAADNFLMRQRKDEGFMFYNLEEQRKLLDFYEGLRKKSKKAARELILRNCNDNYNRYSEIETELFHKLEREGRIR